MIDKKYSIGDNKSQKAEVEDSILTISEEEAALIENPFNKRVLQLFWSFVVIILALMSLRVFYLTIVKGDHYAKIAKGNSVRSIPIKAPRGKIFDRYGTVLVNNMPSMDAVFVPIDLPDNKSDKSNVAEQVAKILNMDKDDILNIFSSADKNSSRPVLLKEKINQNESLMLMEKSTGLAGIKIEKTATRKYVDSLIFSHILGYEGKIIQDELENHPDYLMTDYIGKQGLEKSYEYYLRGDYGAKKVEVNSLGKIKKEIEVIDPKPGSDLILNVDAKLQKKVFDTLSNFVQNEEIKAASAVAIDPRDGGILALASVPSYDNNLFASGISSQDYRKLAQNPANPMFNRAISGEYPPGSTIKPLIAGAALEEDIINAQTRIESRGGIQVGDYFFGDWKTHGYTDLRRAIAVSSDVYFYSIGGGYGGVRGLGMKKMKYYDNAAGLGNKTGIDIPGEASGFIPDPEWKKEIIGERWYVGNSYHASIGQGYITATPLQIANYISAIANGGILYKPRVVFQIKKNSGDVVVNAAKINKKLPISKKNLDIVKEGMRMTVTEGTAKTLNDMQMKIAGKNRNIPVWKRRENTWVVRVLCSL